MVASNAAIVMDPQFSPKHGHDDDHPIKSSQPAKLAKPANVVACDAIVQVSTSINYLEFESFNNFPLTINIHVLMMYILTLIYDFTWSGVEHNYGRKQKTTT